MPHDDDEPVYDRLITYEPSDAVPLRSKSPRLGRVGADKTIGYSRVRRQNRALRESVVQFADDLMERQLAEGRKAWTPEPVEHTVGVCSPSVQMHYSKSTSIPQRKPQMAAPLSKIPGHKRSASEHRRSHASDMKVFATSPQEEMPMTPGQVHELTKRFSFAPGSVKASPSARLSMSGEYGSPMRATVAAMDMTKNQFALGQSGETPANGDVKLRDTPNKKGVKVRPMSWDASLIFSADKQRPKTVKPDEAMETSQDEAGSDSPKFARDSNARVPVRRRTPPVEDKAADIEPRRRSQTVVRASSQESKLPQPSTREQLSQGSQGSSQEENVTPVSVKERTMRWEARGGGVPSYFSTLPRSFRHKATSGSMPPSPSSSSATYRSRTLKRESTLTTLMSPPETTAQARTRHMSVGSASQSSKIPSPRTSVSSPGESRQSSRIPLPASSLSQSTTAYSRQSSLSGRHSPQSSHSLEDSIGSSLQRSLGFDDTELWKMIEEAERAGGEAMSAEEGSKVDPPVGTEKDSELSQSRARQGSSSSTKASHLPVIKSRTVTVTSIRSKGQTLLPTKTQVRRLL